MNTKNLLLSSLIGGVIIAALSNIPVISLINCLLCAGIWGGAIFAAWLYKRFEGSLNIGQGTAVGALAGLWAGLIGLLFSLIGMAGLVSALQSVQQFIPSDVNINSGWGFFSLIFGIGNLFITIFFGTIGGLIGGAVFQSPPAPQAVAVTGPVPPPSPAPVISTPAQPVEVIIEESVEVEAPEEPTAGEEAKPEA
jgi:hypothetical protein